MKNNFDQVNSIMNNIFSTYIKRDISGQYSVIFFRTFISVGLSALAYKFISFEAAGAYAIIAGLFTVQMAYGENLKSRLLHIILAIVLILIDVFITAYLSYYKIDIIQVFLLAFLTGFAVYAFSTHKSYAVILLYLSIFNVIVFGLGATSEMAIFMTLKAVFAGGICALIALLIIPVSHINWKQAILRTLIHEIIDFSNYQYELGFYDNFSDIRVRDKNIILNYHVSLITLLTQVKNKHLINKEFDIDFFVNGLILLSYWPVSAFHINNASVINNLRSRTFYLLSRIFNDYLYHQNKKDFLSNTAEVVLNIKDTIAHVNMDNQYKSIIHHIELLIDESIVLCNQLSLRK